MWSLTTGPSLGSGPSGRVGAWSLDTLEGPPCATGGSGQEEPDPQREFG